MPHDTHVIDGFNKDIGLMSPEDAKEHYLSLCEGWVPYNPNPVVIEHEGVLVVRDDLTVGTKTRAGDLLMSKVKANTLVYCQPRVGLAGVSLCDVAQRHPEKKIVLFMPSSKKISVHQACCIERGATPIFERIAAMPNLNLYAKKWATENNAYFIPLGLKHELATAAIVHAASTIPEPDEVYVAISTGVLSRALQIAWPNAKFTCVAVARNLKAGELGRADVISEPLDFPQTEKAENLPPFPTVNSYDAKVWKWIPKNTGRRILMWNVGTDPILHDKSIIDNTDSYRDWKKNDAQ
jgi:hypothetical protein